MPKRNVYDGIDTRIIDLGIYSPLVRSALTSYSLGDMDRDEALVQIILAQDEANSNQTKQIMGMIKGTSLAVFPQLPIPIVKDWLETLPLRKPIHLSLEDIRDSPEVEKFRETDSHIHFICGYVSVSIEKSILRKGD